MSTRHDLVAERQLLAMALSGHPSVRARFLALPVLVWHPSHEPVATVLRDRFRRGIPVNAVTVGADVAAAVDEIHGRLLAKLINECSMSCPPLETWVYYAEQVLTCFTVREADRHAERLHQQLETVVDPQEVGELIRSASEGLGAVTDNLTHQAAEPPVSLQDLIDEPDEKYDWLVPGLWERMDRVMITAFEGCGKSTLLRQFALCIAGGVHPFTGEIVNRGGSRVLVLDYENSRRQVRRKFQQARGYIDFLREQAALPPVDWREQLRLEITPEGVDLANIQQYARLEQKIAAAAPDLVVAGPVYRMSKLDIKDDQAAKTMCDALDRLRVKYRFCLILEAHVGHVGESQGGRKVRPFGSSLFLRWPEFGFGLRGFGDAVGKEHPDVVELVAWRGSREERAWPSLLKHSRDTLPWVVAQHDYQANLAG